jgi:hypothetical protein
MSELPPGPFYSDWGPEDGPIRHRNISYSIGVDGPPGSPPPGEDHIQLTRDQ